MNDFQIRAQSVQTAEPGGEKREREKKKEGKIHPVITLLLASSLAVMRAAITLQELITTANRDGANYGAAAQLIRPRT